MPGTLRTRIGIAVAVVGALAAGAAALLVFSWTIHETRFDRPDPAFDALAADVTAVPGVSDVSGQRWVEAPPFLDPSSWMHVTADVSAFDAVRALACENAYPDAVSWSVDLDAAAGTRVSASAAEERGCPAFGFDVEPVASEIARVAPGSVVQAAVREPGLFAITSLDGAPSDALSGLLPLVAHADTLREVAGVGRETTVEVSGPQLGVELAPGEGAGYHSLLTALIADHGVTYFSFGGAGTPIDGVERVQVRAPNAQHPAIERLIAGSGLPVASLPVAFLE